MNRLYFRQLLSLSFFLKVLPSFTFGNAARKWIYISSFIDVRHASFLQLDARLSPESLLLTFYQVKMPIFRIILKDFKAIIDAYVVCHRLIHFFGRKLSQQRNRRLFALLMR